MTAVGRAQARGRWEETVREREWERERACVCGVCGTLFLETCAHCHFEQCSSRSRWGNLSRSLFLTLSLSLSPRIHQAFAVGLGFASEAVLSWFWVGLEWERESVSYLPVSQLLNLILQLTAVCLNGLMDSHMPAPPPPFLLLDWTLTKAPGDCWRFNRAAETAVCLNWY